MDFLNKWMEGLTKTRKQTFGRIATLFGAADITEDTWEELESLLVQADIGVETTESVMEPCAFGLKKMGFSALPTCRIRCAKNYWFASIPLH